MCIKVSTPEAGAIVILIYKEIALKHSLKFTKDIRNP
jgi:hypothetical protein